MRGYPRGSGRDLIDVPGTGAYGIAMRRTTKGGRDPAVVFVRDGEARS